MGQKLPAIKPAKVIKALKKAGFYIDHQTGSHIIMYKSDSLPPVSVPYHNRDLAKGTLKNILKQSKLTLEEFNRLLKK